GRHGTGSRDGKPLERQNPPLSPSTAGEMGKPHLPKGTPLLGRYPPHRQDAGAPRNTDHCDDGTTEDD
ncbi:hypothetical protein NDU88_001786, partial [Pleurodeles waltl]